MRKKCVQNSVRIHAKKCRQSCQKKDSAVLLVDRTLSIRGFLCIWYSLQITLRLRGATPTNRHPLQSCGFSREIHWYFCLEVVMNLSLQTKWVTKRFMWKFKQKYFICGFAKVHQCTFKKCFTEIIWILLPNVHKVDSKNSISKGITKWAAKTILDFYFFLLGNWIIFTLQHLNTW